MSKIVSITVAISPPIHYGLGNGVVEILDECGSDTDGNMWWQYSGYDENGDRVFCLENCPVIIHYENEKT